MSLPLDDEAHELKLGNSFDQKPKVGFHTIRYDFKPASVDTAKESCVEVGRGNQVTVTVPHVEGCGIPHTVFKGNKQKLMKECVLIINHDTGTFTLEKLTSKVALKKTRSEGSSKAMQHMSGGRVTPVDSRKTTPSKSKAKSKVSPEKEKEKEFSGASSIDSLKDDSKRSAEMLESKRIAEMLESKRIAEISESKRIAEISESKRIAEMSESKRIAEISESKRIAEMDSKKIGEISDSSSSSSDDDDEDMEVVKSNAAPQQPPPPPPQKAAPKFKPSSSSSSSRSYGVLDNDLALSESSSDDDSD